MEFDKWYEEYEVDIERQLQWGTMTIKDVARAGRNSLLEKDEPEHEMPFSNSIERKVSGPSSTLMWELAEEEDRFMAIEEYGPMNDYGAGDPNNFGDQ